MHAAFRLFFFFTLFNILNYKYKRRYWLELFPYMNLYKDFNSFSFKCKLHTDLLPSLEFVKLFILDPGLKISTIHLQHFLSLNCNTALEHKFAFPVS